MIENIHERILQTAIADVGIFIDELGSKTDRVWPADRWPKIRFESALEVGARGGHGPIRYTVESYQPGRSITFRFTAPRGFIGTHGFEIDYLGRNQILLRHVLRMRVKGIARFSWPLVFRPLHDALVEDALDRAECFAKFQLVMARPLSRRVRLLRWLAWRFMQRSSKQFTPKSVDRVLKPGVSS